MALPLRALELPSPARPTGDPMAQLLSPAALAALAPTAAGVPARLWRRALLGPVQAMLSRPGKGFRARLTETAFRLGGGLGEPPPALARLLEVVHAGSMIIDDIEDGSTVRRGGPAVHRLCGVPLALNAGNWMYFAPLALLPTLGLAPAAELHLHRRIGRVLLDCHYGQALDLGAQLGATPPEEVGDLVATLSLLKTGRLVGLCAELGAVAAGADEGRRTAIVDFGEALGVGLQMLDDLGNLAPTQDREKRHEDLRQGRVTWAWSWAAALDADRFAALVAERERLQARGDAPWAELAARLRGLVEAHGRRQAHHHLHQALARLRADLGASARRSLDALARELQRLEASYG